ALAAQDEVDRKVAGQLGRGDVVVVNTVHDELSRRLVDEGLELDSHRRHHTRPNIRTPLDLADCLITSRQTSARLLTTNKKIARPADARPPGDRLGRSAQIPAPGRQGLPGYRAARAAPSASAFSFAHAICGWVRPPKPQSVPAMTFSAPSRRT